MPLSEIKTVSVDSITVSDITLSDIADQRSIEIRKEYLTSLNDRRSLDYKPGTFYEWFGTEAGSDG